MSLPWLSKLLLTIVIGSVSVKASRDDTGVNAGEYRDISHPVLGQFTNASMHHHNSPATSLSQLEGTSRRAGVWPEKPDFDTADVQLTCMQKWIEHFGNLRTETAQMAFGVLQIKEAEKAIKELKENQYAALFSAEEVGDFASEDGVRSYIEQAEQLVQQLSKASTEYQSKVSGLLESSKQQLRNANAECGEGTADAAGEVVDIRIPSLSGSFGGSGTAFDPFRIPAFKPQDRSHRLGQPVTAATVNGGGNERRNSTNSSSPDIGRPSNIPNDHGQPGGVSGEVRGVGKVSDKQPQPADDDRPKPSRVSNSSDVGNATRDSDPYGLAESNSSGRLRESQDNSSHDQNIGVPVHVSDSHEQLGEVSGEVRSGRVSDAHTNSAHDDLEGSRVNNTHDRPGDAAQDRKVEDLFQSSAQQYLHSMSSASNNSGEARRKPAGSSPNESGELGSDNRSTNQSGEPQLKVVGGSDDDSRDERAKDSIIGVWYFIKDKKTGSLGHFSVQHKRGKRMSMTNEVTFDGTTRNVTHDTESPDYYVAAGTNSQIRFRKPPESYAMVIGSVYAAKIMLVQFRKNAEEPWGETTQAHKDPGGLPGEWAYEGVTILISGHDDNYFFQDTRAPLQNKEPRKLIRDSEDKWLVADIVSPFTTGFGKKGKIRLRQDNGWLDMEFQEESEFPTWSEHMQAIKTKMWVEEPNISPEPHRNDDELPPVHDHETSSDQASHVEVREHVENEHVENTRVSGGQCFCCVGSCKADSRDKLSKTAIRQFQDRGVKFDENEEYCTQCDWYREWDSAASFVNDSFSKLSERAGCIPGVIQPFREPLPHNISDDPTDPNSAYKNCNPHFLNQLGFDKSTEEESHRVESKQPGTKIKQPGKWVNASTGGNNVRKKLGCEVAPDAEIDLEKHEPIVVRSVDDDSWCAEWGVTPGSEIWAINGVNVTSAKPEDVWSAIGDPHTILFKRPDESGRKERSSEGKPFNKTAQVERVKDIPVETVVPEVVHVPEAQPPVVRQKIEELPVVRKKLIALPVMDTPRERLDVPKASLLPERPVQPVANATRQTVQIHLHIDGQTMARLQSANATNMSKKINSSLPVLPIALAAPVAALQPNIVSASPIVMQSQPMPQMILPAMPPIQVVAPPTLGAVAPPSAGFGLQDHLLASEIAERKERADRAERAERDAAEERAERRERAERAEREAARYAERVERADRLAQLSLLSNDRSERASRESRADQLFRMDFADRAERMARADQRDRAQAMQEELMMLAERDRERDMSRPTLDRFDRASRAERLLDLLSQRDQRERDSLHFLDAIDRAKHDRLDRLRDHEAERDAYGDKAMRTPPWLPDPSNDFDRELLSFLASQSQGRGNYEHSLAALLDGPNTRQSRDYSDEFDPVLGVASH